MSKPFDQLPVCEVSDAGCSYLIYVMPANALIEVPSHYAPVRSGSIHGLHP